MEVQNCWDFKQCGNGPQSDNPCVTSGFTNADGYLGGTNGGRACFFITTTKCQSTEDLYNPKKFVEVCSKCDFYTEMNDRYGPLQFFDFLDHLYEKMQKS